MNGYEKAVSLGLTGTDAEIVATLKATGVTSRPIVLSELLFLLNFRGILTKLVSNNSDEKWTGTVLAMKAAITADAVAIAHVDRWLSHITNPRNTHWDTADVNYSAPFWAMSQAVAGGLGMPSVADFTEVAALGGGWLFADLTAEQFAAQRQDAIDAQAAMNLAAEWSTLLNESLHPSASNRADLIAALRSAASTLENG